MPVREGRLDRTFRFGELATLTMLDLRSYRTDTTILGAAQRDWLVDTLTTDRARWQLVGNSVMLSPLKVPPLPGLPPTNPDQWDGFPADRELVLRSLDERKNTVFLTGDIHTSWANNVPLGDKSVASEFVATSVTSDNFDERIGIPPRTGSLAIEAQFMALNPHVKFVELDSHGASVLTVTPEEVRMDWHYVADKTRPEHRRRQGPHVPDPARHRSGRARALNDEGRFHPPEVDKSALHPEIRPGRPGRRGP